MKKKWIIGTLVTMLLLAGCNKEEVTNEAEVPEEVEETVEVIEEEEIVYPYQFPFTGIGVEKEPNARAIAVMINNDPKARPQSGMHKADIVFEMLAEGNVTRFLAIYQSEEAERIGPVRSARDYFIELAKGYDAIYIAHGYSPKAKQMLDSRYIDHINGMQYDGTLFRRDSSRVAPHNSYITMENIFEGAKKLGYDLESPPAALPFLTEEEVEGLSGEKATSVFISYYSSNLFNVIFEYDEEFEKYKRYSNGKLTADLDSNEPVLLDNIFIIETSHKVLDSEGRREINFQSGGKGYLLQKGQYQEVEWKNVNGKILPVKDGKEVGFVPGKTWINVVPTSPGLEESVSFGEVQN